MELHLRRMVTSPQKLLAVTCLLKSPLYPDPGTFTGEKSVYLSSQGGGRSISLQAPSAE